MLQLILAVFFALQQHHGPPHTFEDTDKWAREFEDPERNEWQKPDAVVAAMNLRTGDRVADIGAGSGYFARRFARVVGPAGVVYAVDIEPNMLRYISERAKEQSHENIVPVLARADDPMLAPESVDVIFICDTIHHVEDRARYYRILQKDLAPGGRLIIVDFEKRIGTPVGPPLDMRIAKEDLVREITAGGFRLKEDRDFLPYQYFLIFER